MAPTFNTDFQPSYGVVERLSPLIRRVVANNPNVFTFTGTGVYLVGNGDVAVVDPGPSVDEHIDAVFAALDPGERITHVLITHTHTDHTAGVAKVVQRSGAPTYGFGPHGPIPDFNPLDVVTFDEYFSAEEKESFEKAWRDVPEELKREGPDPDFRPDRPVADGDRIEGGDWTIEAIHTPGHTSNHVCYRLVEEATVFTGDHVMGWATSVISPPDGDLFDYLASLDKLLTVNDVRYLPTHGAPIDDPHTLVRHLIEHRRSRERQILDGLAAGPSTIKDLVPGMYADTDKRLWRAAANSVWSHLLALHRQGLVTTVANSAVSDTASEPGLTATYGLVG
jgi:glyoxylase-like metal-dependent hydrolase (beta-lactamase superfamily II)